MFSKTNAQWIANLITTREYLDTQVRHNMVLKTDLVKLYTSTVRRIDAQLQELLAEEPVKPE